MEPTVPSEEYTRWKVWHELARVKQILAMRPVQLWDASIFLYREGEEFRR
jgi:hypothetical protein